MARSRVDLKERSVAKLCHHRLYEKGFRPADYMPIGCANMNSYVAHFRVEMNAEECEVRAAADAEAKKLLAMMLDGSAAARYLYNVYVEVKTRYVHEDNEMLYKLTFYRH